MAKAVKETPVLEGKDAKRFEEQMKLNENRKVPREEYTRAIKNFKKFVVA